MLEPLLDRQGGNCKFGGPDVLLFFHLFPLCLRVHRVVARRLALLQYGSDVSFLVSDTPHQGHLHCAEARLFLLPPSHVGNYAAHGLVLDIPTLYHHACLHVSSVSLCCMVINIISPLHIKSPLHSKKSADQACKSRGKQLTVILVTVV